MKVTHLEKEVWTLDFHPSVRSSFWHFRLYFVLNLYRSTLLCRSIHFCWFNQGNRIIDGSLIGRFCCCWDWWLMLWLMCDVAYKPEINDAMTHAQKARTWIIYLSTSRTKHDLRTDTKRREIHHDACYWTRCWWSSIRKEIMELIQWRQEFATTWIRTISVETSIKRRGDESLLHLGASRRETAIYGSDKYLFGQGRGWLQFS